MARKSMKTTKKRQNSYTQPIRRKKRKESFSLYIYKVLKEICVSKEAKGINRKAMNIMNSMVFDIFEQLTQQSAQLLRYTKKRTLTFKEIETCVKLLFPYDLAQHAIQEGRKAVEKFKNLD